MALSLCNTTVDEHGMELVEHGTALFPVAFYHDDLLEEDVPWHWHDELEIFLVSEGATEVVAGSERYIIEEGDGIFINSGILHAAWLHGTQGCRYHSMVFHPRLVGGSADSVFWQNYIDPLLEDGSSNGILFRREEPWQEEILELVEQAWQCGVKERPGYEFEVREALSKIICRLVLQRPTRDRSISEKTLRDEERMKVMLQYIQEHCEEEITVNQIAECASISASECLRCFHNTIGVTPIQYVLQYRIQMAAGMLADCDEKISNIGMRCGFQDMSYFARIFRRMKGVTPSEYRRQHLRKC